MMTSCLATESGRPAVAGCWLQTEHLRSLAVAASTAAHGAKPGCAAVCRSCGNATDDMLTLAKDTRSG
eukprot:CAMPEP_0168470866 /NCGR_PEP_ID=MMETSP0228-20121227/58971_1 /TAXON_ID=133427 /ORGANISM="Protoceratium reticulatum, Strain CCCM 535 (=CCMP 1889)" /LENGTH=67 /DNA_ID=CAMNT_0008486725 /DNA_START=1 /DNA_END=201 /DNA_ORIENTATION=-